MDALQAWTQNNPALASAAFDYRAHRQAWRDTVKAAQRHNDPGAFTAFLAYEWTASTPAPEAAAHHRNLIFRGGAAPTRPFRALDSRNPDQYSPPHGSYVREALVNGLALKFEGRGNPFRMAFIGSSDAHNSVPSMMNPTISDPPS